MTDDERLSLKRRIVEILYSELYADGLGDIDGRQEAASRIIAEIVEPRDAS
jgi:hypothetical protein